MTPPTRGARRLTCRGDGYTAPMRFLDDEPLSEELVRDSIAGIELQIVELVEQQRRAEVQGRAEDAARLQPEIDALHGQLATAADVVATGELSGPGD